MVIFCLKQDLNKFFLNQRWKITALPLLFTPKQNGGERSESMGGRWGRWGGADRQTDSRPTILSTVNRRLVLLRLVLLLVLLNI